MQYKLDENRTSTVSKREPARRADGEDGRIHWMGSGMFLFCLLQGITAGLGKRFMRLVGRLAGPVVLVVFAVVAAECGAQARFDAEAVRTNNRGVAQMGQQFTERAAGTFAEAFKKDEKLAQAAERGHCADGAAEA